MEFLFHVSSPDISNFKCRIFGVIINRALPTPIHSQPLSVTLSHSRLLPPTPTESHPFSAHSYPLPLMFNPLLLILSPPPLMCSLSHPFPVHIQILSPNPTHHQPFQPNLDHVFLRAYVNFKVNLFFLLSSALFGKQFTTLGSLITTFAYFQGIFFH